MRSFVGTELDAEPHPRHRLRMDYYAIAERMKPGMRRVLLRHVDALASIFAEPIEPRSLGYTQSLNALVVMGLIRLCHTADGPPLPARSVLTNAGRCVLAELLAVMAEELWRLTPPDSLVKRRPRTVDRACGLIP